jgi:hypothetical protein
MEDEGFSGIVLFRVSFLLCNFYTLHRGYDWLCYGFHFGIHAPNMLLMPF